MESEQAAQAHVVQLNFSEALWEGRTLYCKQHVDSSGVHHVSRGVEASSHRSQLDVVLHKTWSIHLLVVKVAGQT